MKRFVDKFKRKEAFSVEETIEYFKLTSFQTNWNIINDRIVVHGDFNFGLSVGYFPFPIIKVEGNLSVPRVGLPNDLSSLPRIVTGSLVLCGNKFGKPYAFPEFGGGIDLSCCANLSDVSELTQKEINGDVWLNSCNFTVLKNTSVEKINGKLFADDNKINTVTVSAEILGDVHLHRNFLTATPSLNCKGIIHTNGNPVNPDDQLESSMWG